MTYAALASCFAHYNIVYRIKACSQQTNWTELNWTLVHTLQPCSRSTSWRWRAWPITRRINGSTWCSSVQFSLLTSTVNISSGIHVFTTAWRSVQFICCTPPLLIIVNRCGLKFGISPQRREWYRQTCTLHTYLTALFPGLPRWAGTRKVKPIWILLKQETVSGNGISWAICKSTPRSRQITTPAPTTQFFYRPDALPAPIQQRQSTEGKWYRMVNYVIDWACVDAVVGWRHSELRGKHDAHSATDAWQDSATTTRWRQRRQRQCVYICSLTMYGTGIEQHKRYYTSH